MAAPRPRSRDFGAALAGLVLGGSVMFLIILTIVWLTNSHFAGKKEEEKGGRETPQAVLPTPGAVPSTTGTAAAAPVAPAPTTTPAPTPVRVKR